MGIKRIGALIFAVLLEFCVLFGMVQFQQNILMSLPLAVRAVLMIVLQWTLLIVPVIFMHLSKITLSDIGFSKANLHIQVLTGVILGIAMSFVFTIVPILSGYKDMVGSRSYTQVWQFCYEFVYMILGVALVEEFFFRGFIFKLLLDIKNSKWFAITLSSLIFGISHIFIGNFIQLFSTTLLGIFFCLCREKIRHCSILSLIIAHGIHNALITLFVSIL